MNKLDEMKAILSHNNLGPNGECPQTGGTCNHCECVTMRHSAIVVAQCEAVLEAMKAAHDLPA